MYGDTSPFGQPFQIFESDDNARHIITSSAISFRVRGQAMIEDLRSATVKPDGKTKEKRNMIAVSKEITAVRGPYSILLATHSQSPDWHRSSLIFRLKLEILEVQCVILIKRSEGIKLSPKVYRERMLDTA